jgi:hypothetical protein
MRPLASLWRALLVVRCVVSAPVAAAVVAVPAGGDLQAALTAARAGDVIVLEAGARYVGTVTLPMTPFAQAVTIRSSATLPDRRVTPADAALLPTPRQLR